MVYNYPRAYIVEVSNDGQNWQEAVANQKGKDGETAIAFNATKAKFIRLRLTENLAQDSEDFAWAMRSMKVYVRN